MPGRRRLATRPVRAAAYTGGGSGSWPARVFVPLAFLEGLQGVFFRALAITMVVSLLTSLVLALTLTPTLAARWMGRRGERQGARSEETDSSSSLAPRPSPLLRPAEYRSRNRSLSVVEDISRLDPENSGEIGRHQPHLPAVTTRAPYRQRKIRPDRTT